MSDTARQACARLRVPEENCLRQTALSARSNHWTIDKTTAMPYIMDDGKFQWDDTKATTNWRDHGVTFVHATKAIADPFAIEWIDDRENYGEERINLLGMCNGVLLHVTYKEQGECIRVISARRAERYEQDHYYRENSI